MIFENLRKKLIRKLGGYVVDPDREPGCIKLIPYQKSYVTLEASYFKDHPDILNGKDLKEWVYKELAYKLADEMLKEDLIRFVEFPYVGDNSLIKNRVVASITLEDHRLPKPKIPQEGKSENE